jgi:hypothetical protein
MKAKEIITEIERLNSRDFSGGKEYLGSSIPKNVQWKPLPGGSGLQWGLEKSHYGSLNVCIIDASLTPPPPKPFVPPERMAWWDNATYQWRVKAAKQDWAEEQQGGKIQLVGRLSLHPHKGIFKNAYEVHTITVDEDRRGIGLALALYGIVLTQMGATLVSGDSQTPGGRRNWLNIASVPGAVVKGLLRIGDENFGPTKVLPKNAGQWEKNDYKSYYANADKKIDMLMQLGFQYLGEKKEYSSVNHFFSFDVKAGKGPYGGPELAPAIKNQLSGIYEKYSTLLYAQWTGQQ